MKTEIFDKIVNLVAETTELKKECILSSCKTEDLVAARCLFVHFCAASGIPTISIAEYMKRKKPTCVNNYLASYESFYKSSPFFRSMRNTIAKKLPEVCPELSNNTNATV